MTGWLVDTNVLSELRRPNPSKRVAHFWSTQPLEKLHVSVVTFAEIRFGIEQLPDSGRRSDLIEWLDNRLRPKFEGRILGLSEDILLKWRLLIESGRRRGQTYSHPDILIAATAAHHGLTVVTRNIDEFSAAGLPVYDPWSGTQINTKSR